MMLSGCQGGPHRFPGELVTSLPASLRPLLNLVLPISALGALVATPHRSPVPEITGLPAPSSHPPHSTKSKDLLKMKT